MHDVFFTICLASGITAGALITTTLALIALGKVRV